MRKRRLLSPRAVAWACLAVTFASLTVARADDIPTASFAYSEIKLPGNSGRVFALGFMPSEKDKLYWGTDEGGVGHLYTYDLRSQTLTELPGVIPSTLLPSGLAWSPDGRQVAFTRGPVLKIVGLSPRVSHNLFLGGLGQWGDMFWTPNGYIVTSCAPDAHVPRRLCATYVATGLTTTLTAPGEGSVYAVGYIEGANKLIYERWNPGEGPNPAHIYSASIFSDHVGNLVPLSYPDIRSEGYLSLTPDGRYGVTIGQSPQAQDRALDVYVGDLASGNWQRVPSHADWGQTTLAALSPDHRHLVVVSLDGKAGYRLWSADVPDKFVDSLNATH